MSDKNPMVVVGSVAVDWVITPDGEREESVGGSATYFAMSASYFVPTSLVGVVGNDFPQQAVKDLESKKVDLEGLEVVDDGLTFRWKGRYHENMNDRDTLETHLNCFESFEPKLPEGYQEADVLFLANIQPSLQMQVLDQMKSRPRLVGLDTMNLWIDIAKDDPEAVLAKVDVLVINDQEARQMTGKDGLNYAAKYIRALGPKVLVIKRGEYGALLFGPEEDDIFAAPGMLIDDVKDPTGAGDCFAGGFMGYLAQAGNLSSDTLRRAVIYGSTMASFCVTSFSYDAVAAMTDEDVKSRYDQFVRLTQFD
jgi:sugar/nucleoside kinase (ribokinase family)